MFTVPNNALQNVMACRVFRQLRLGVLPNASDPPDVVGSIPLNWRQARNNDMSFERGRSGDFQATGDPKSSNLDFPGYPGSMQIKVTRDVETGDVKYVP